MLPNLYNVGLRHEMNRIAGDRKFYNFTVWKKDGNLLEKDLTTLIDSVKLDSTTMWELV